MTCCECQCHRCICTCTNTDCSCSWRQPLCYVVGETSTPFIRIFTQTYAGVVTQVDYTLTGAVLIIPEDAVVQVCT